MQVQELYDIIEQIRSNLRNNELPDGSCKLNLTKVYIALELARKELEASIAEYASA